ncbi:hypothetical protein ATO6_20340 [Oceanicola sp. 22II-s10i]|uniref:flagellar hook-associated protein FlgK n=1 Tax=Oceanicola sp. 22II-s10i TaxID=1317116 RepID=UPI000B521C93|nr:flagellar hook-associated protein FlgK [Oceanicola sp. 22II-s10i]OWU83192.1 hypothetical protein ATO6_20340 [Oceanicola sp. 22II-s10i]
MSIASALNAAQSGLSFASRWAQTTSTNIANANNEGYARRGLLVTTTTQGDVMVSDIRRAVDASLDRMYRAETARAGKQGAMADGLSVYTSVLGTQESSDGLVARMTDLRASFGLLSVSPSDTALQRAAVTDAEELASTLNRLNSGLQQARNEVAGKVEADISTINSSLTRLAQLNERIARERSGSELHLSLSDQIMKELDTLAPMMDFTLRTTGSGQVEINATGGAEILRGETANLLSYDMTTGKLTAGTQDITPGVDGVRGLSEGGLAGRIELLNTVMPGLQGQLDETARALIDAFAGADPTTGAGGVGLFTDAGGAPGTPVTPGLAGRIAVNDAVLPEAGGALWRMRDGMGAAAEGQASDATIINSMIAAFDAKTTFDTSVGLGSSATLTQFAATLIAEQQSVRATAESARDTAVAGADALQATRAGFMGVNVDDELQQLMQIEQAYGANAKVMSSVNQMIQTLLDAI